MAIELTDLALPSEVLIRIQERKQKLTAEDEFLIGKGGYTAEEADILEDALIALALGKNVLLKGPTGSGKTKLAETLSYLFSQPMHSVNCSVDLDAEALLGFKTIAEKNGKQGIEFVSGPVINAMKKGQLLYIDEINMAKPETLPILNGVLDYRKMITNPFTGEVVKGKETFGVIAAINEGYVGTVPLNEALKNRFVVIDVPYIQGESLRQVLKTQSQLQDEKLINQFVQLSGDLITQVSNGHISEEAASIRALLDTCDLALYMPPLRAIKRGIIEKLEDEREKAAIQNIAETLFE
ncbi:MoxR family ATPase [Priestia flexa]|uniref:ATP-binding protein n=1 Tax=Priestia flexa TaxID=86664 RepID=UPI000957167E|nr:MoxR family ATPase [Priestia flexa]MBY6085843.1 MoxR family ATPase [Priestia flexa]MCA1201196.1 MoxR family ATPase [Priestia flexa]MCG7312476.1 MoxR family ATPase [Priestia flexa]WHX80630.1 MoxR family ATPase [Priestia flexa]SIQ93819.1 MoxR-like ATPase [Priestia flexa]